MRVVRNDVVLRLLTTGIVISALAACGSQQGFTESIDSTTSAADLGAAYGACHDDNIDSDDARSVLGVVVDWRRIDAIPDDVRDGEAMRSRRTVDIRLDATEIGPGRVVRGEPVSTRFRMHGSFLPGLAWAVDHAGAGALAYVGSQPADSESKSASEPGLVVVVAVRTPSGDYFFPGACQDRIVRRALADRFGIGAAQWVDNVIGRTGDDLRAAVTQG